MAKILEQHFGDIVCVEDDHMMVRSLGLQGIYPFPLDGLGDPKVGMKVKLLYYSDDTWRVRRA